MQSVTSFKVSPIGSGRGTEITAIIIPRVTCELPLRPVSHDLNWKHLSDLPLADPGFGEPGKIDVLLGADVFADVLLHGRRTG